MTRKDVFRQTIVDLSPHPSAFDKRPLPRAPKSGTKTLTTEHDIDNPVLGTGIFSHDVTNDISYELLLRRLFLQQDHFPSLNTYGKIEEQNVIPYIVAVGNKRTIFSNFADVCRSLKRDKDHVSEFIARELGTSCSFDKHERLVLKGRFRSKQMENMVGRYNVTYVKCSSCASTSTDLAKTDGRAMLVKCNACRNETRAPAIKTGYAQTIGRRRRPKEEIPKEPEPESDTGPEAEVIHGPGHHCFVDFAVKSKL